MRWTTLSLIPVEDWFSKGLSKETDEMNKRIEQVLEARGRCETCISNLGSGDVAEADLLNTVSFPAARLTMLETLQLELKVRRELVDYLEGHRKGLTAAAATARTNHDKARSTLISKLEDAGYLPWTDSNPQAGEWTPGMVLRNPLVRQSAARAEGLARRANIDRTWDRANDQAIRTITEQLERARQQGLPA